MDKEQIKQLGDSLGEKIKDGISDCTKAIDALKEAQEKQAEEINVLKSKNVVSVPGLAEEKEKRKGTAEDFSFCKTAFAIATGNWDNAGFEKEVIDAARTKALSQGTDADGGYIVPEEYVADIIELIRAETVLDKLGVTNINPTGAPVTIPRLAGGATAYWLAENASITESQQTLEEITLSPNMVAAFTPMSRRVAAMSNPSIEAMVRQDLARALANEMDIKGLEGDGTSNTPTGILNQTDILTYSVGTDGDVANFQLFSELEGLLEDNNTLRGNLGFATIPKIIRKLKNQRIANFSGQTDGSYINAPLVSNAKLAQELGYDFQTTTAIDATGTKGAGTALTSVYFGNWSEMIKAMWGSLMLDATTSGGDAFQKHQIYIKAVAEVDYAVRHPKSFAVATDVITA